MNFGDAGDLGDFGDVGDAGNAGNVGGNVNRPRPRPGDGAWGFLATLGFTLLITFVYMALQVKLALAVLALTTAAMSFGGGGGEAGGGAGSMKAARDVGAALSNGFIVSLVILAAAPMGTALTVAAAFLKRGLPMREYFALKSVPLRTAVIWLLVTAASILLYDQVQSRLFDLPEVPDFMLNVYTTAGSLPLLYVSFVLFAPLFEETLFRGFLFKGIQRGCDPPRQCGCDPPRQCGCDPPRQCGCDNMTQRPRHPLRQRGAIGSVGAVVITSALWTAIHFQYDLYVMGNIFLLGLLIGAARLKTGSIGVPYAMHAVNNLMALAATGLHLGSR
jgi:hypothetical protein